MPLPKDATKRELRQHVAALENELTKVHEVRDFVPWYLCKLLGGRVVITPELLEEPPGMLSTYRLSDGSIRVEAH